MIGFLIRALALSFWPLHLQRMGLFVELWHDLNSLNLGGIAKAFKRHAPLT